MMAAFHTSLVVFPLPIVHLPAEPAPLELCQTKQTIRNDSIFPLIFRQDSTSFTKGTMTAEVDSEFRALCFMRLTTAAAQLIVEAPATSLIVEAPATSRWKTTGSHWNIKSATYQSQHQGCLP